MVDEVKKLDVGINVNGEKIGILLYADDVVFLLLYADDVVFLCEKENDLQKILDTLSLWCNTNDLTVNINKSKQFHFRTQSTDRTDFEFMLNDNILDIVPHYMYLGLLLTEVLNYNDMAKAVAKSASKSLTLGLLIAKCKANGGFEYSTFTKLFDSLVMSVIEYGASIWGSKDFSFINAVKNKSNAVFYGCRKIHAKFSSLW